MSPLIKSFKHPIHEPVSLFSKWFKSSEHLIHRQSPGETKRRELELGSHSWMDNYIAAEPFLNSCFSDTVFVTLFRTAVKTAICGGHKLFRISRALTSLTLLFWRWLMVSLVFMGQSAWASYSSLPDPPHPPSPSLINLMVSMDVEHHAYLF